MAATLTAGDPTIDFTLTDADGTTRSSDAARNSGLLLYAFYKRTCGTCQYTMPFLQRFQEHYAGDAFEIWGIAQESAAEAAAFARQHGATFPQLVDEALDVTERYDLVSVPAIYLADGSGRILRSAQGFVADELNAMANVVAQRTGKPYRAIVKDSDNAPPFKPG